MLSVEKLYPTRERNAEEATKAALLTDFYKLCLGYPNIHTTLTAPVHMDDYLDGIDVAFRHELEDAKLLNQDRTQGTLVMIAATSEIVQKIGISPEKYQVVVLGDWQDVMTIKGVALFQPWRGYGVVIWNTEKQKVEKFINQDSLLEEIVSTIGIGLDKEKYLRTVTPSTIARYSGSAIAWQDLGFDAFVDLRNRYSLANNILKALDSGDLEKRWYLARLMEASNGYSTQFLMASACICEVPPEFHPGTIQELKVFRVNSQLPDIQIWSIPPIIQHDAYFVMHPWTAQRLQDQIAILTERNILEPRDETICAYTTSAFRSLIDRQMEHRYKTSLPIWITTRSRALERSNLLRVSQKNAELYEDIVRSPLPEGIGVIFDNQMVSVRSEISSGIFFDHSSITRILPNLAPCELFLPMHALYNYPDGSLGRQLPLAIQFATVLGIDPVEYIKRNLFIPSVRMLDAFSRYRHIPDLHGQNIYGKLRNGQIVTAYAHDLGDSRPRSFNGMEGMEYYNNVSLIFFGYLWWGFFRPAIKQLMQAFPQPELVEKHMKDALMDTIEELLTDDIQEKILRGAGIFPSSLGHVFFSADDQRNPVSYHNKAYRAFWPAQ